MRIGPHELGSRVLLAPMAGVTDRTFRRICRRYGAALAPAEMVTADTALWATAKTRARLDIAGDPPPRAVQIVGNDPARMAEAARRQADLGAQIVDINMGCPAKKVCRKAAGSALLRDEPLVARILEAVVRAVDVPVTLKMRTGWDRAHRNGVRIARIAEAAGVCALAVHGRTRADRFAGEAEYETIAAIKAAVSIPVVANGDIDGPGKAAAVLAATGADAVMVGRAARGRPWIFREIDAWLERGARVPPPGPEEVLAVVAEHLEGLYALHGREHGVRVARKHLGWYLAGRPQAAAWRARINRAATPEAQLALARACLLADAAGERAA